MEEKKQEDNLNVTDDVETTSLNTETTVAPEAVADNVVGSESPTEVVEINEVATSQPGKNFNLKAYVGGVLAILLILLL